MKNNKKLGRKRYIGNALTNAFFPVLTSLGLTLGVVATTVTLQTRTSSGESARNHIIEIDTTPQPGHDGWNVVMYDDDGKPVTKAKKDDVVHFLVSKEQIVQSNELEQDPTEILINDHRFPLEYVEGESQKLKTTVTIPFIEKMTVKLLFPKYDNECVLGFYDNHSETSQTLLTQIKTPKNQTLQSVPSDPTWEGHNFLGWFDEKTGGNPIIPEGGANPTLITDDMSIYAHWEDAQEPEIRTLTFKDQTAEGWSLTATDKDGKSVTTIKKGMKVNFSVKTSNVKTSNSLTPTKVILTDKTHTEGEAISSTFNLTKNVSTGAYYANNIEIPYDANIEAEYKIEDVKPEQQWVVAFNTMGGTDVSSQKVWDYETIDTTGEKVKTDREGYGFGGWYEKPDYSGNPFDLSTPITKNTTLYAKWNINQYSIQYYLDWDSEYHKPRGDLYEEVTADHGSMPYPQLGNPTKTKEGHTITFLGWQLVIDGELSQDVGIYEATKDAMYIAKWDDQINQCTVTFDSTGGTEVESQTVNYNTTITRPEDPTKTGYKDPVWYDEKNEVFNFDKPVKKSQKLHAEWTIKKYKCKFVNTDGTTPVGTEVEADYNTLPVPTDTPTEPSETEEKHTYTFKGWRQIEPTESQVIGINPIIADNTKYIAEFEDTPPQKLAIKVVIEFNDVTTEKFYSIDANTKVPEEFEPDKTELEAANKSFAGWYKDKECAMTPLPDGIVTESTTLYAKIVPKYTTEISKFVTEANETGVTIKSFNPATITANTYDVAIPDKLPDPEGNYKPVTKIDGFIPTTNSNRAKLRNVNIPDTVTDIAADVFKECEKLESINLENVVHIGDRAFKGDISLKKVRISYKCKKLGDTTEVSGTITESTVIDCGAFHGCTHLHRIQCIATPPGWNGTRQLVVGVGCFAHMGANQIYSMQLPKTLLQICPCAFDRYRNNYVYTLAYEGTKPDWENQVTKDTWWYGREGDTNHSVLKFVQCADGETIDLGR